MYRLKRFVIVLLLPVVSLIAAGCAESSDHDPYYIGVDDTFGGADRSVLTDSLLQSINSRRSRWNADNPSAVPLAMLAIDNEASRKCQYYANFRMYFPHSRYKLEYFIFEDASIDYYVTCGYANTVNGSTTVTGVNTYWRDREVVDGTMQVAGSGLYKVASLNNENSIVLSAPFVDGDFTNAAYYIVHYGQGPVNASVYEAITAVNYADPSVLVGDWYLSDDVAIILNQDYTHIGVGLVDPGATWAVVFFRK